MALHFSSLSHNMFGLNFSGEFQIGDNLTPLDPETIASVVRYGTYGLEITDEATGYSLIYNQLYPFEGLQNYTSGIIHHVCLTGTVSGAMSAHLCILSNVWLCQYAHDVFVCLSSSHIRPFLFTVVSGVNMFLFTLSIFIWPCRTTLLVTKQELLSRTVIPRQVVLLGLLLTQPIGVKSRLA